MVTITDHFGSNYVYTYIPSIFFDLFDDPEECTYIFWKLNT